MAIPLTNYETMDSFILLSAVNLMLRDYYVSLDELCKAQEIDKDKLVSRLEKAGFTYNLEQNQFK